MLLQQSSPTEHKASIEQHQTTAGLELYRRESLQRLQSVETFDGLLVTVSRRAWIAVASIALLSLTGLAWAVFGSIPVSVSGMGVLINPGNVRAIESNAAGQITELLVREGESVQAGDVIATLNQPELRKRIEQEKARLEETLRFNQIGQALDDERRELELGSSEEQRTVIDREIAKLTSLTNRLEQQHAAFSHKQRDNAEAGKHRKRRLADTYAARLATVEALRKKGYATKQLLLDAEVALNHNQTELASLDARLVELDLQAIQNEQTLLEQHNRLSDLRLQLLKLDIGRKKLLQELTQNKRTRESHLRTIQDRIEQLELSLEQESRITSKHDGCILELATGEGQVIQAGERLATMELSGKRACLKNLAYFAVQDGKRVQPGDCVSVTPTTVKRERYGGMVGRVVSVSEFPITREGALNAVGNAPIAETLLQQGGAIEVVVELVRDSRNHSGFRWTSRGPDLKFSAGTTTTVRVTVDRRAPIGYVLPILRTWVFGQKDSEGPVR